MAWWAVYQSQAEILRDINRTAFQAKPLLLDIRDIAGVDIMSEASRQVRDQQMVLGYLYELEMSSKTLILPACYHPELRVNPRIWSSVGP